MVVLMTDEYAFPNTDDLDYVYPVRTIVMAQVNDDTFKAVVTQTFPGPYPYLIEHWITGKEHRCSKVEVYALEYPVSTPEDAEKFLAS